MSKRRTRYCGMCVEGDQPGSKRLYGTCVCDYHYRTPNYRMLAKSTVVKKYGVPPEWIEDMAKQGFLRIYKVPNPHNPGRAPPMKLIREYQVWSLIQRIQHHV